MHKIWYHTFLDLCFTVLRQKFIIIYSIFVDYLQFLIMYYRFVFSYSVQLLNVQVIPGSDYGKTFSG